MLFAWLSPGALAHDVDTSYVRIRLRPGVIETRVTFDALTLQKIAPDLDANRDDLLSRAELEAATTTVQAFIEANILLELDKKSTELGIASPPYWPLDAPDPLPRDKWHDQTALFLFPYARTLEKAPERIQLDIEAFPTVGAAHRFLSVFENGKQTQPVILSANRATQVFFVNPEAPNTSASSEPAPAQPSPASQFFLEGIKHILEGYDHICFLLALLVAATRLRQVVLIVTAFTIAHSITLILAAQGIIHLPSRLIESAIAATIVYVAVENLIRLEPRFRWGLTFVFGLIHGFGFANVLSELTLPTDAMVSSLLVFNVGVEVGQLAIVVVVWPLLRLINGAPWGAKVKVAINVLAGLLGLAWLLDRVFRLGLMPF